MLAGAYVGGVLVALGVAAVTYPAWGQIAPQSFVWGDSWVATVRVAAEGVAALLVFPWYVRFVVWLDKLLVRALLEPSPARARIAALEAGRAALRADADALLRRVERDLHDGTQGRLVALGMALSRIEARATDPQLAAMAADARQSVVDALSELRDIVRGMHPPALDAGLPTALESLAARSAVPVELRVDLPDRPPPATESALYFSAAELLNNVTRHAGARSARLELHAADGAVRLAVADDGRGGAILDGAGTGLRGLAERVAAIDGSLRVDSPAGGPTVVTVELPCES
jgi:signal transduction histidine kinase